MRRAIDYLAHHAIAITALTAAALGLAGGSYAALTNSGSTTRAWAVVSPNGRLIAGAGRPRVSTVGAPGQYEIDWGVAVTRHCATNATVDAIASKPTEALNGGSFVAGYASAGTFGFFNHRLHRRTGRTIVETFNQTGQPTPLGFDVTVVC